MALAAGSSYYVTLVPGNEKEVHLGPLALFSFIVPTHCERIAYNDGYHPLKTALCSHLKNGFFLNTKEKGVMYPVIHFTDDRESLKKQLTDELNLENEYVLHQGVYREVRSIRPENITKNGNVVQPQHIGYIVLGFKSLDKNFNQVMVDSWKDWTGARYIYMYLPDELGLTRISFYHREAPDSLNMFMYIVLVECQGIVTKEHQLRLLDFAQRIRVERMSGFVSVYGVSTNQ
uniref:DUF7153 domain-containing protein n=1 Tax=Clastoptera arizonana TaxID=38151 RepID=A0A1B6D5Y4_9HEMI